MLSDAAQAVAHGEHFAVGADDCVGGKALAEPAQGVLALRLGQAPAGGAVEVEDFCAMVVVNRAPVGKQVFERVGADAALLHAHARVSCESVHVCLTR